MKRCKYCYSVLIDPRSDQVFCGDVCKAAYHREFGQTYSHQRLRKDFTEYCQWCGEPFTFNAYADRSGQRRPLYCCNAHRAAAHRAKKHGGTFKDSREYKRKYGYAGTHESKKERKTASGGSQGTNSTKGEWWESRDWWIVLGVTPQDSWGTIRDAYRKLVRIYHPDVCKLDNATQIMQAINGAFEIAKRRKGKRQV